MSLNITIIIFIIVISFILPEEVYAQTCGVFHIPSNAHLTYSGNSWDCNRGFKRSIDGLSCEEIFVPDHATFNLIGSYYCSSGYKLVGGGCEKAKDVENGRFYEFGSDFYCLNGYNKNEESRQCGKIIIPANAKTDSSSLDGWSCLRGYIKQEGECKKFELPGHAFWSGDFWKCEPGYKKNPEQKICEKIKIPENAYPSDTFDGWLCNSGYTKNYRENRCDKTN